MKAFPEKPRDHKIQHLLSFSINGTNGKHTSLVSTEMEIQNIAAHSYPMLLLVIFKWISINIVMYAFMQKST